MATSVEGFEERNIDDSVSYLPVVSFTDREGRAHWFTSVAGRSGPTPPVGTTATVRYDRSNPGFALISPFLHEWAAPVAFQPAGVLALIPRPAVAVEATNRIRVRAIFLATTSNVDRQPCRPPADSADDSHPL